MNRRTFSPPAIVLGLLIGLILLSVPGDPAFGETVEATQWAPYLEWTLEKQTHRGNPYDIRATVTFTHTHTGDRHVTETFYDGGETWKFRFTGGRSRPPAPTPTWTARRAPSSSVRTRTRSSAGS